jgi:hypothetical protein
MDHIAMHGNGGKKDLTLSRDVNKASNIKAKAG